MRDHPQMDTSIETQGAPASVPDIHRQAARITYMYLRWLMILLPAVLLIVNVATAIQQKELETSISAYYGGPVRDVFVGVMVATAACLVAYQGTSTLEDYTLNGAGFYAVFVALVPTNLDEVLQTLRDAQNPDAITPSDYIWFMRVALTTVLGLCAFLLWRELTDSKRMKAFWDSKPLNRAFIFVTGAVLTAFLALAMAQLWLPDADDVTMEGIQLGAIGLRIHDLAAIFFICALAVSVWTHAWPEAAARQTNQVVGRTDLAVRHGYQVVFLLMLGGLVVAWGASSLWPDHVVIVLEWWEVILFGVFWYLETRRVGRVLADT